MTSYFRFIESCAPQPTLGGNFSGPGQADPIFSFYLLGEIPNHWLQFTPFCTWYSVWSSLGWRNFQKTLNPWTERYPRKHLKVRSDHFSVQLETSNHPHPLPAATEETDHTVINFSVWIFQENSFCHFPFSRSDKQKGTWHRLKPKKLSAEHTL